MSFNVSFYSISFPLNTRLFAEDYIKAKKFSPGSKKRLRQFFLKKWRQYVTIWLNERCQHRKWNQRQHCSRRIFSCFFGVNNVVFPRDVSTSKKTTLISKHKIRLHQLNPLLNPIRKLPTFAVKAPVWIRIFCKLFYLSIILIIKFFIFLNGI